MSETGFKTHWTDRSFPPTLLLLSLTSHTNSPERLHVLTDGRLLMFHVGGRLLHATLNFRTAYLVVCHETLGPSAAQQGPRPNLSAQDAELLVSPKGPLPEECLRKLKCP